MFDTTNALCKEIGSEIFFPEKHEAYLVTYAKWEIAKRIRRHLVNAHINNYEARAEEWQEIGHTETMEASR